MTAFYKNYQLEFKVLGLGIILIFFILLIKSMIIHDDFFYPGKNTITSFQTIFSFTDQGKAAVHLKNTEDLYNDFIRIMKKDPQDLRLVVIAHEMGFEEALAIKHMDLAKKQGTNITEEVEKLCDMLELQQKQLQFIVLVVKPEMRDEIQQALNVTNEDLQKAMDW